jgi:S1-C subfamily serine protease
MTLVTAAMALLGTYWGAREAHNSLAQGHTSTGAELKAIDSEMRQSLLQRPLPSAVSRAYEQVIPSVVRVTGYATTSWPTKGPEPTPDGVGTGVVIVDNGTILTNLHVVRKAKRLKVMFFDGHESEAEVIHEDPSSDLAMLRAKSIPDDLQAATLRSSTSLRPGDEILSIGFPFGIGPSVSSGVISGLGREYRSPDGQQTINNLIQFDAAANPGNSGGPLVTLEGDVVGVVTAILNPSQQRVFIGIGFAMPIENATKGAGPSPF